MKATFPEHQTTTPESPNWRAIETANKWWIKQLLREMQQGRRTFDEVVAQIARKGTALARLYSMTASHLGRAEQEAQTDALTGIPNRAAFEKRREQLVAQERPFGFLIMDLNGFKQINDTYGHDAGDKALNATAATLIGTNLRLEREDSEADFVARLGGDEFVALLPGVSDPDQLNSIAQRIMEEFSDKSLSLAEDGSEEGTTIKLSIGGAIYQKGQNWVDFSHQVDGAMYKAKEQSKSGPEVTTQAVILPLTREEVAA